MRFRPSLNSPWQVALLFAALTAAYTWPLPAHFASKNASDLGDPLFICWVLMWTGGQVLRFLGGDFNALADYWNGNIFYPEKLTLAYSEHFTGQMLQILPVWAATGNIILSYNLLFASTFVLSGLGMYLFVREVTGKPLAGIVAGVAFAFAPYRADQLPHLQVLSSQWMPFALYGFRRYFSTGRIRPLAGASAALVMQVWSCGYYLFFFVPFAVAYCLWELATRGMWRNGRVALQLAVAGVITVALMLPMLLPYTEVRATQNLGKRDARELAGFSADAYAFATSSVHLRLRTMKAFEKTEGQAFAGFAVLIFAAIGMVGLVAARRGPSAAQQTAKWRIAVAALAAAAGVAIAAALILTFKTGRNEADLFGLVISVRDRAAAVFKILGCVAIVLVLLPRLRAWITRSASTLTGFALAAAVVSALLAMGPNLMVHGRVLMPGPYQWLFAYVPGFDGLRVPARFVMIMVLFLSVAAGCGAAWLIERSKKIGAAVAVIGATVMLAEGWIAPMEIGRVLWPGFQFAMTDFDFPSRKTLSPVYVTLRDTPGDAVVAEFPFGKDTYDIRWTYMAGFHRKKLLNGFSGFFPDSFKMRAPTLWDPIQNPPYAWKILMDAGVTHAIVHESAFNETKGAEISAWLRASGARELAVSGTDRLFAIR